MRGAQLVGALTTVHVVDDDPGFLAATSRFLGAAGLLVTSYDSGSDLLPQVSAETRGCVVTNLDLPDMTGLELQRLLVLRGVAMPVVFLAGHGDVPGTLRALRSGSGDLSNLAPALQLLTAVVRALEQDAETYAARTRFEGCRRRIAQLTERQREVLALVVGGKMNKQIAAALGIHERTVKLHRTAITTKLGVHAVAQLAVLASEAGLLEDSTVGSGVREWRQFAEPVNAPAML